MRIGTRAIHYGPQDILREIIRYRISLSAQIMIVLLGIRKSDNFSQFRSNAALAHELGATSFIEAKEFPHSLEANPRFPEDGFER